MTEKRSEVYENDSFENTEDLTLRCIEVFKETCLINNNDISATVSQNLNINDSDIRNNNNKAYETVFPIEIISKATESEDFEEIVLRPTETNDKKSHSVRPITECQKFEKPPRKSSLWKRTLNKSKRRHTTPTGLVEKELCKLNISGPSNLHTIDVSETQNVQFSRESIQACPFDISGYGDFILTDDFKVQKPKSMVLTAFLFEKIIIFTKATNTNSYYYVGSINMENVSLEPPSKSTKKIVIKDFTNSVKFRKDITFTLTALSEITQAKWRQAINRCLWGQFLKTKQHNLPKEN